MGVNRSGDHARAHFHASPKANPQTDVNTQANVHTTPNPYSGSDPYAYYDGHADLDSNHHGYAYGYCDAHTDGNVYDLSQRVHEWSLAGAARRSIGFRDQGLGLGT